MKSIKAYAPDGEHITVICPHCGIMRQGSLKKIKTSKHTFNVRCRCDEVFTVVLELRKSYRKKTYLLGSYESIAKPGKRGGVTVENLSLTGVGISFDGTQRLLVGETLRLHFTLDDSHRTVITRKVIVRHVHDDYAGCEFVTGTAASDKALGYYLMP